MKAVQEMAKYKIRNNRLQPHPDTLFWNDREDSREDSGVQLDEPLSPLSKNLDDNPKDIVNELTNPHLSKQSVCHSKYENKHGTSAETRKGGRSTHSSSETGGIMGNLSKVDRGEKRGTHNSIGSPKRQSESNHCDKSAHMAHNSQDIDIEFTVTLNLEEDEGLEIRDMTSELPGGDNYVTSHKEIEDEDTSTDESTEISDIKEVDSTDGLLGSKDKHVRSEKHSEKKDKDSKKRRFRKMIGRPLRRSQSAGCETDLQVPEHALFLGEKFDMEKREEGRTCKRTIHKTTSADAAMMAQVLPVDPNDLGLARSKPKTSLAKNMKRKLQALRRRNTDSSLGVTIMKLHGPTKVTQADTVEWSKSFESLLMDKTGLELFRNFLKSEFSEENIDFWIACEEFKTTRTNKLAQKAEQIYTDFVAIKAPKQVNLDSKTRLETVTNLDNPTRDMYKSAQKRIQYLMEKDPYPRFLQSEIFLQIARQSSRSDSR